MGGRRYWYSGDHLDSGGFDRDCYYLSEANYEFSQQYLEDHYPAESEHYRLNASVTVFLSLILMMVMTLLLTLAEGVHLLGVTVGQKQLSAYATEGALGEYNRILWEEYGILGVDAGYGKDRFDLSELEQRLRVRLEEELEDTLYQASLTSCAVRSYQTLTDQKAGPFIRQAARQEVSQMGQAGIDRLLEYVQGEESSTDKPDLLSMLQKGKTALEELQKEKKGKEEPKESSPDHDRKKEGEQSGDEVRSGREKHSASSGRQPKTNPIQTALAWKSKAILAQVLPPDAKLSEASLPDGNDRPSKRKRIQGTFEEKREADLKDQGLFRLYLRDHFSRFGKQEGKKHAFSYEMEYILCGKESDKSNLEAMVVRLLALRELDNCRCLLGDPARMAQVEELAVLLAGATLNPAVLQLVKGGIVAAWAYLESVLDIRLIMAGGKAALLKNPAEWTSDIYEFPAYLDTAVRAKESAGGVGYDMYLMALLLLADSGDLALRAMDLMEASIRREEGYGGTHMDHMICGLKMHYGYEARRYFQILPGKNMLPWYQREYEETCAYQ